MDTTYWQTGHIVRIKDEVVKNDNRLAGLINLWRIEAIEGVDPEDLKVMNRVVGQCANQATTGHADNKIVKLSNINGMKIDIPQAEIEGQPIGTKLDKYIIHSYLLAATVVKSDEELPVYIRADFVSYVHSTVSVDEDMTMQELAASPEFTEVHQIQTYLVENGFSDALNFVVALTAVIE